MSKKYKRFRRVCAATAVIGIFLMFGTAGASDCDIIPLGQIIAQSITGLLLFTGGLWLGGYLS